MVFLQYFTKQTRAKQTTLRIADEYIFRLIYIYLNAP